MNPALHHLLRRLRALALPLALIAGSVPAADQTPLQRGQALFTADAVPACALCHTLKAAGAQGAIGPSLDELKPDATRVAAALRNGIGQMPSYADKLDEQQIAAIAAYVALSVGALK